MNKKITTLFVALALAGVAFLQQQRATSDTWVRWDDLRVVPGAFQFAGVADPTLVDWQPGGSGTTFKVYAFQVGDVAYASCQMPHGYKLGSDIYVHLHWTAKDRGNEESGAAVGWKVQYSIADIGDAFPASSEADLSDTVTGTDHVHEIASSVQITGTGLNISHMIMIAITRTDTGTDDTWAGTSTAQSPALLEVDFHFQVDDRGSINETSKD